MVKRLLASVLALLLVVPAVLSCGPAAATETTLIPATANAVMQMQVDKIVNNSAVILAYGELEKGKAGWPQTATDALNQIVDKTGVDLTTVSKAVFFADVESTSENQSNMYGGVVVTGKFNESTLVDKIQQQAKQTLTTSDYKGFKVYEGAQDKFEIVFLSQGQIVLGTAKAVRDTIDVRRGDQKGLSGSVIDTLDRFGNALITGAFAPPESLRSQLGKAVPQQPGLSLTAFQNIDAIGFSVDLPGLTVSTRLDAHFSNTASVQDAKDAITGLISVAKGTSQDPNVKAALGNIQVTTSDSWLSVRDTISVAEIGSLIGSIQPKK